METLVKRISILAKEMPEKKAVCFKDSILTYSELYNGAAAMAAILREKGVKAGDRVSFSAVSKPEMVVTYLALQLIGAVSVFLDKNASAAAMKYIYTDSDSVLLLTDKPMKEYADGTSILSLRTICQEALSGAKTDVEVPDRDPDDMSEILFTTGTTAKPKGVILSVKAVRNILGNTIQGIGIKEDEILLLPVPLNHSFALRVLRAALYQGATVVLQNGFTFAKEVENNISKFGCTAMAAVPASYEVMRSQMQDVLPRVLGGLRYIEFGAGALSPRQRRELGELLPGVHIFNTWGSSESGGAVFCDVTELLKSNSQISSLGKPLTGKVELRIIGSDGKDTVGDMEHPGRMAIKGDMIMSGYWKNDELTRETIKDGWLLTSDLVYRDSEGYVYMLGRADDIINVGGEKVSPVEVEAVAGEYPDVIECACIGVNDWEEVLGEVPVLFLRPNNSYSEKDLIKYMSGRLEKYKLPKKYVVVESIPRNRMQKIDRKAVRALWEDQESLDLMNPVVQAILSRRSVRRFTDKDIPKKVLEMILRSGYHAPSGHNMQSWRFTVLRNESDIAKLKETARISAEKEKVDFYGFENPKVMILISNDDRNPNGCQDSSCAAENIMLAATSYGVSSVWLNPLRKLRQVEPVKSVLDSFDIPENHTVWASIALGYSEVPGATLQKKTNVIKYID